MAVVAKKKKPVASYETIIMRNLTTEEKMRLKVAAAQYAGKGVPLQDYCRVVLLESLKKK